MSKTSVKQFRHDQLLPGGILRNLIRFTINDWKRRGSSASSVSVCGTVVATLHAVLRKVQETGKPITTVDVVFDNVEHKEVNTDYILNILAGKDKNIVLSKSNFKTGLITNYLLTDNTKIIKNSWNIPEPVDGIEIKNNKIEVIFVPLLAFDKQGHRVGYGKGFYDTFLKSCNPKTIKIGLSFFEAEPKIENITEYDIPLDYCVTPDKFYSF